jgi:hypothetical protein
MKNVFRLLIISIFCIALADNSYAYKNPNQNKSKINHKATAAGCAAASGFTDLNINNVRARINTGGDMWWDLLDVAKYYIPASELTTSMFSASLWIGGLDVNDQLKLAAQRYRGSGNDYWPGPLTVDGTAAVDEETCTKYDKFFRMHRSEVDEYLAWWNAGVYDSQNGTTTQLDNYPNYTIPASILEWPAHGDITKNQSYYLAPFYDYDGDGDYDPNQGDYPYYDVTNALCPSLLPYGTPLERTMEGNGILVDQVIKGDQTLWWVFNDKGNIHTETQGSAIGMEIRAQAFAFSTNDEINNMTFYSFEIINRSTFRLTETYFSQWVDTDLGDAWDDYVGCDVGRGLGYCYNGVAVDGSGRPSDYGTQPPAIGVDFFQGPYMDPDGLDNPKTDASGEPLCDVSINGINFANDIVDDERFGMRRFVYHNNTGGYWAMTDPDVAAEYYNFLRGIWKDGIKMKFGGNAHPNSGSTDLDCDFMFPGNTDPCNWGTGGTQPSGYATGAGGTGVYWTEENVGNQPYDRRFMQSAGPFTLEPGAVNYITVGIPWARATNGGPWASVELLRVVDDKCQKLFDNCFKVVDGPDAPQLIVQELDREIILYIDNPITSNNYMEQYEEYDPNITSPDTLASDQRYDSTYNFEGYQIYQLKDASVSVSELDDPDRARLVAQCDVQNGVGQLVNYYFDQQLNGNVPVEEVDGSDNGVVHSFRILEDEFATEDSRLVNHKQYYYMAIAYAYNEYAPYSQLPSVINGLYGQKEPYLAGRKSPTGQITAVTAIPHISSPERNGTVLNSSYGDGPEITRIEGQGNGGLILNLKKESIDELLSKTAPPFRIDNPVYEENYGPINVKVVDPLKVVNSEFILKFDSLFAVKRHDVTGNGLIISGGDTASVYSATWTLTSIDLNKTYKSETAIDVNNEQLLLDIGLSIQFTQVFEPGPYNVGRIPDEPNPDYIAWGVLSNNNGLLTSSMEFADSTKFWLYGIPDSDNPGAYNWIRSGNLLDEDSPENNDWNMSADPAKIFDPAEDYEKVVGGLWGPYNMTTFFKGGISAGGQGDEAPAFSVDSKNRTKMKNLASVDIVITADKSKWTRSPVIEMASDPLLSDGGVERFYLRAGKSVNVDGETGVSSSDPMYNSEFIDSTGMGWFPGYAINVETGERLNIVFGENSWLAGENGKDMIWNPTANFTSDLGQTLWGGMHYIYIMGHNYDRNDSLLSCPAYDYGQWLMRQFRFVHPSPAIEYINRSKVFSNAMWVNIPVVINEDQFLSNDVTVKIRIAKPYMPYYASKFDTAADPKNNNMPMYSFKTENIATRTNVSEAAISALDIINVVPNPYYGFSGYESDQLDNRVKITNLPEKCTITIYNVSGTLIRQFTKDDISTSVDWDLKNQAGIPIAGGIYLIHVKANGIGEKIVKWFGALRPVDLNAF